MQNKISGLVNLINQTKEEKSIMNEDLLSKLLQKQEKLIVQEELEIHKENLENTLKALGKNKDENEILKNYFIEFIQIIFQEFGGKLFKEKKIDLLQTAENSINFLFENLGKMTSSEIEKYFVEKICPVLSIKPNLSKIQKNKENYLKNILNLQTKFQLELSQTIEIQVKIENNIKEIDNFINNTLNPAIKVVFLRKSKKNSLKIQYQNMNQNVKL